MVRLNTQSVAVAVAVAVAPVPFPAMESESVWVSSVGLPAIHSLSCIYVVILHGHIKIFPIQAT